ncbi:hypothetical protein NF867_15730 [Solitalea sp. MAHUQ-68]|uniref:Uncharacterized protein n=1 Tax=Solitalea agri TaxID=2953739 RepID=A0A9X2F3Z9_9SPHI|nr:hypothetical protein [Solitalea agri]MCO4294312.1 hypothetical protein [Solitalea agri]
MDKQEEKKEFKPAVMYFPTPDVKVETSKEDNITTTRQYSVVVPKSERDDFMIQVRASQINEIRETCDGIKDEKFPIAEITLFVTSALIGSTISALFSELKITDNWGKINFIFFPIICAVLGTVYFFKRKDNIKNLHEIAQQVLKKLPNPNEEKK